MDLFAPGAQEHWYGAYPILYEQAPVLVLPGRGPGGVTDALVLNAYKDIERVVKGPERFTPVMSLAAFQYRRVLFCIFVLVLGM